MQIPVGISYMLSIHHKSIWAVRIISSLGIFLILLGSWSKVDANGSHSGAQQVFSGIPGDYQLRVLMMPMVGNGHMSIF